MRISKNQNSEYKLDLIFDDLDQWSQLKIPYESITNGSWVIFINHVCQQQKGTTFSHEDSISLRFKLNKPFWWLNKPFKK